MAFKIFDAPPMCARPLVFVAEKEREKEKKRERESATALDFVLSLCHLRTWRAFESG